MPTKEAQINVRLPSDLDAWLEARAGGKRAKPALVRKILERERAREEEQQLRALFDAAWDSLSAEEQSGLRAEREEWMGGYAGGSGS